MNASSYHEFCSGSFRTPFKMWFSYVEGLMTRSRSVDLIIFCCVTVVLSWEGTTLAQLFPFAIFLCFFTSVYGKMILNVYTNPSTTKTLKSLANCFIVSKLQLFAWIFFFYKCVDINTRT